MYFITPKFEYIWCLNQNLNISSYNKVIYLQQSIIDDIIMNLYRNKA